MNGKKNFKAQIICSQSVDGIGLAGSVRAGSISELYRRVKLLVLKAESSGATASVSIFENGKKII